MLRIFPTQCFVQLWMNNCYFRSDIDIIHTGFYHCQRCSKQALCFGRYLLLKRSSCVPVTLVKVIVFVCHIARVKPLSKIYVLKWLCRSTAVRVWCVLWKFSIWCGFDRASSLICGNKMPTRCNRWFLLQILLLAQHVSGAPLCPSSGAREYYTSGCCLSYLVLWF